MDGTQRKTVLKETATKTSSGNYGVFSGPGENYLRAEEGGAHVRPEEKCYVIGSEGDWAFVRVAAASGAFYGYMPVAALPDKDRIKDLSFDCVPTVTIVTAALRDAPSDAADMLINLPANAEINFLAWSDTAHSYAYVEYKADGLRVRGFIPADNIGE